MTRACHFSFLIASLASVAFTALVVCVASAAPVSAQEFLNPVQPAPANFLEQSAINSGGATGAQSNSSNLQTGAGAIDVSMQRQFSLNQAGNGLLGMNSVNMAPTPSGTFNYGFSQPNYGPGLPNQYGLYNGQPLAPTATSSAEGNVVDCPSLASNYATGQYNPWANPNTLYVRNAKGKWVLLNSQQANSLLQETAAEAQTFLQNSLKDATAAFQ